MSAQTMAGPSTDLVTSAWQRTPSLPGTRCSHPLLPIQQTAYLCVLLLPGHWLRHHLLQLLDQPGKHPGDQKQLLDLAAEAFDPKAAVPLATACGTHAEAATAVTCCRPQPGTEG